MSGRYAWRRRPPLTGGATDLPVLLPAADRLARRAAAERVIGPAPRLTAAHGWVLAAVFVLSWGAAYAQGTGAGSPDPLAALWRWLPLLMEGFVFNILISFMAMAIGTGVGIALGLGQVSLLVPVRGSSWLITQFFRNAPWLVLLFFVMFLMPFEFVIGGLTIPFPDWIKATIGLALPVMANVSEIVRGAVNSVPSGQWESANSLAFSRTQTLFQIILPQCLKRMIPPWMNLYAILTMATVLASIVGVSEMVTLTRRALAAEANAAGLLVPFYSFVLLCFFAYCYPIARFTAYLERRFAVQL